jgi:hypothetical protein
MSDYEITNAIASATDATHARAWEESQFGEARAETLVDHEYIEDLVATWSMVATQREIRQPRRLSHRCGVGSLTCESDPTADTGYTDHGILRNSPRRN